MTDQPEEEPLWEVQYDKVHRWRDVIRARTAADACVILGDRIRAGEAHHSEPEHGVQAIKWTGTRRLGSVANVSRSPDTPRIELT